MEFPVMLRLGPVAIHPHFFFELLSYTIGGQLYVWWSRRRPSTIAPETRGWIMIAALFGALIGSKLVYWLSDPLLFATSLGSPDFIFGGKSIVGGILAGYIAIEITKRFLGIRESTGDSFVVPLCVGMAIGRVGCFLTGLDDHTHGLPTSLPWAIDYGDGIPRHPAQLYEIAFLLLLAPLMAWLESRPHVPGSVFQAFLLAYFSFRFFLEFLKPGVQFGPFNAIQWVCLVTVCVTAVRWLVEFRTHPQEAAVHG